MRGGDCGRDQVRGRHTQGRAGRVGEARIRCRPARDSRRPRSRPGLPPLPRPGLGRVGYGGSDRHDERGDADTERRVPVPIRPGQPQRTDDENAERGQHQGGAEHSTAARAARDGVGGGGTRHGGEGGRGGDPGDRGRCGTADPRERRHQYAGGDDSTEDDASRRGGRPAGRGGVEPECRGQRKPTPMRAGRVGRCDQSRTDAGQQRERAGDHRRRPPVRARHCRHGQARPGQA